MQLAREPSPSGPWEEQMLRLDVSKARQKLGWSPLLSIREAVELTVAWYQAYLARPTASEMLAELTQKQIGDYTRRMQNDFVGKK